MNLIHIKYTFKHIIRFHNSIHNDIVFETYYHVKVPKLMINPASCNYDKSDKLTLLGEEIYNGFDLIYKNWKKNLETIRNNMYNKNLFLNSSDFELDDFINLINNNNKFSKEELSTIYLFITHINVKYWTCLIYDDTGLNVTHYLKI